ncbi:MAG: amidohydrolase family protein [Synergistaceae bacterium]|nr:amidohydrolase family protein [Synergistaceae bacterium]
MVNDSKGFWRAGIRWFFVVCFVLVTGILVTNGNAAADQFVPSMAEYDAAKIYAYYNGNIYNEYVPVSDKKGGGKYSTISAMVTKGQWIEWVGNATTEEALKAILAGEGVAADNVVFIDLKGATVLPGLMENHMHFVGQGELSLRIDSFWKPKQIIIESVVNEAKRLNAEWEAEGKPGAVPWLISRGWLHTLGGDWDVHHPDTHLDWPTRWELDGPMKEAGVDHIPVFLRRADGHSAWVNTAALNIAFENQKAKSGVDYWAKPEFINANGGNDIILNSKGEPIGILAGGNAREVLLNPVMPALTDTQLRFAIRAVESEILSYGLTSIMDAGAPLRTIEFLEEAYSDKAKPLKIRIYQELSVEADGKFNDGNGFKAFPNRGHVPTAVAGAPNHLNLNRPAGTEKVHGPRVNDFDLKYTIRNVKFYADGSLGSRTADFLKEYADDPGNSGSPRTLPVDAEVLIEESIKYGFQNSAHVIGDAGNKMYINAYEKALNKVKNGEITPSPLWGGLNEKNDYRARLEHFQVVDLIEQDDIQRAIDLGMIPSMQFVHATSDMNMAEARVGAERIKGGYAWRTVLNKGGIIANGTDANVELLNPYHSLYAAVTRIGRNQIVPAGFKAEFISGTKNFTADSGWFLEQKLSRAEALAASTQWGAYAQFEEAYKGKLVPGYLADFVVLDRDYFDDNACPDFDIKDINAILTVIGGEVVYAAKAPVFTTSALQNAYAGTPYSVTLKATGTVGFEWSVSQGSLPEGLTLHPTTGVLSGKPETAGVYEFTIAAKNVLGTATQTLSINVEKP